MNIDSDSVRVLFFLCVCFPCTGFLKFHVMLILSMIMIVNLVFSTLCILWRCICILSISLVFFLCSLNKDVLYEYLNSDDMIEQRGYVVAVATIADNQVIF